MGIGTALLVLVMVLFSLPFSVQVFSPEKIKVQPPSATSELAQLPKEREVESKALSAIDRALRDTCYQVWIKGRQAGCSNADSPYFTWSFLYGYSTLKDLLQNCTPSATFSCSAPQEWACYQLRKALSAVQSQTSFYPYSVKLYLYDYPIDYFLTVGAVNSDSDPCAVDGSLVSR